MWVLEQEKGVKIVGGGVEVSAKIIKKFFFLNKGNYGSVIK